MTTKAKTKQEVRDAIKKITLFEFNDEITRNKVLDNLEEEFPDVLVVCNESNNPVSVIDNNELVVDVLIEGTWSKLWFGPKMQVAGKV